MALDVLIVDDSVAIRKVLQRALLQAEIGLGKVYEAMDGIEGLALLEQQSVDLILSDINMPKMDGLTFLQTVRLNPDWAKLPILMVTTEGSQDKVLKALELGANGYVRKPFTPDQFRDQVLAVVLS